LALNQSKCSSITNRQVFFTILAFFIPLAIFFAEGQQKVEKENAY
jgi:hypothetical protein